MLVQCLFSLETAGSTSDLSVAERMGLVKQVQTSSSSELAASGRASEARAIIVERTMAKNRGR